MAQQGEPSESLRVQGNAFYKQQRWEEALHCYSQALELDPHNHSLWTNRSLTYMHLAKRETGEKAFQHWKNMLKDAEAAIEANNTWSKACIQF